MTNTTTIHDIAKLYWVEMTHTIWMTFLPALTDDPRYGRAVAEVEKHEDGWDYQIEVAVKEDGTVKDFIKLTNQDFNIPNGATAQEMGQKVGQLTIEQIKSKLQEKA